MVIGIQLKTEGIGIFFPDIGTPAGHGSRYLVEPLTNRDGAHPD